MPHRRTLAPAAKLESETKAIERKLEEMKSALKQKPGQPRFKAPADEPSMSELTKDRILKVFGEQCPPCEAAGGCRADREEEVGREVHHTR